MARVRYIIIGTLFFADNSEENHVEFNLKPRILIKSGYYILPSPSNALLSDVGLRRTCAYYRTSARAMCVRKCVRKGFVNCVCVVGACGHIFDLRCAIALLSWLIGRQTNM